MTSYTPTFRKQSFQQHNTTINHNIKRGYSMYKIYSSKELLMGLKLLLHKAYKIEI